MRSIIAGGILPHRKKAIGLRPVNREQEDKVMSEEKKNEVTEEVEEASKLSEEDLEQVNGGVKLDPERLRRKVEGPYATY